MKNYPKIFHSSIHKICLEFFSRHSCLLDEMLKKIFNNLYFLYDKYNDYEKIFKSDTLRFDYTIYILCSVCNFEVCYNSVPEPSYIEYAFYLLMYPDLKFKPLQDIIINSKKFSFYINIINESKSDLQEKIDYFSKTQIINPVLFLIYVLKKKNISFEKNFNFLLEMFDNPEIINTTSATLLYSMKLSVSNNEINNLMCEILGKMQKHREIKYKDVKSVDKKFISKDLFENFKLIMNNIYSIKYNEHFKLAIMDIKNEDYNYYIQDKIINFEILCNRIIDTLIKEFNILNIEKEKLNKKEINDRMNSIFSYQNFEKIDYENNTNSIFNNFTKIKENLIKEINKINYDDYLYYDTYRCSVRNEIIKILDKEVYHHDKSNLSRKI